MLTLVILTVACKNSIFYPNHFIRQNKKSTFIKSGYAYEDSILLKVNLCHYHNLEWTPNTTGNLVLNPLQIQHNLIQSYSRYFSFIQEPKIEKAYFGVDCDIKAEDILSKATPQKDGIHSSPQLFASLRISSASMKRLEGGGGLEIAEDMGDDKHRMEYKLITSVYKNGTVIYMDSRIHWTNIFSDRGEQLKYQVPQVVIDSLVTLTLQEYFKRME
jgi:hypothetical protein